MNGLRILLAPFALLYGAGVAVRNWFFDIGVLSTTNVDVPVISVGNVSAGGTGKTPLVEYLARYFKTRGQKTAVISRGYKRNTTGYVIVSNGAQRCAEAAESGDEPSQLAEKLNGVIVVVDEKRVRAAQKVITDFKPDVIVLDDGFQHRYLHRDMDIVIVAGDESLSGSWLLPAGNRRESLGALHRADVIIISRCEDEKTFSSLSKNLAVRFGKPIVWMKVIPKTLMNASTGKIKDVSSVAGKRVIAFSGIGNPEQFETMLKSLSANVVRHHIFSDHHEYANTDLSALADSYSNEQAEMILTTEKDIARLKGNAAGSHRFFAQNPVEAVGIEVDIVGGKDTFESLLGKLLGGVN